nr:hypothetical protein [Allosphingosinicella vermicomposti]
MSDVKPFASLSSGLLARKGTAKPAMRPQGFGHFGAMEDLGWNDMGQQSRPAPQLTPEPMPERQPSSIAALTPGPVSDIAPEPIAEAAPPVVEQQRDLATHFEAPAPEAPAPEAKAIPAPKKRQALDFATTAAPVLPRSRVVPGTKAKAAFTLRLDPERHLRLRLACAVSGRSAQMLVTDALDAYLESISGLDDVASSAKKH